MSNIQKIKCIVEEYKENQTQDGLDNPKLKVFFDEIGLPLKIGIGTLKYDEAEQSYYEDDEYTKERIKFYEHFYNFTYPDWDSVIGQEYEFYFDPKKGKLTYSEPMEYVNFKDLTEPFYKDLEIIKAYVKPQDGIKIFFEFPDKKVFTPSFLSFTTGMGDKKEYDFEKQQRVLDALNTTWKASDIESDEEIEINYLDVADNNLDILIGKKAKIEPQKIGNGKFYKITGFYE